MQSVVDILQNLARQRGQGDKSPLLLLRTLEARQGSLISHLPMDQSLVHAWVNVTGAPFCQHQSLALASMRRSEPVALVGSNAAARQTFHLFLHEFLSNDIPARALLLLPNEDTVPLHLASIDQFNTQLGKPLTVAHIHEEKIPREALAAHVILATPQTVHNRLLRHHDRAWHHLWHDLRLLMLFDLEQYTGVAAAHLSALLLRISRLVGHPPLLAASLAEVAHIETPLFDLIGQSWHIISTSDTPHPATTLAIWRGGAERLSETAKLAIQFQRQGYRVHILCTHLEVPLLLAQIGSGASAISAGPVLHDAHVHIFAGMPDMPLLLQQSCEGSFAAPPQLTLLITGNLPLERTMIARLNRHDESVPLTTHVPLLADAPPIWLAPPTNAYVSSQHLLCAASERLLSRTEINAWHASDMVAHLERRRQLVRLPGDTDTWQPLQSIGDPYEGFALHAAGSDVVTIFDEQDILLAMLDPSAFDRWAYRNATLPPGSSGYRVSTHNDETLSLTVQPAQESRRTFPLRYCEVTVREERDQRRIHNQLIAWGRVVNEEELYAYREYTSDSKVTDQAVVPSLTTRWTSPAVWIDLPVQLKATGQLVGWSVVWVLPVYVLCTSLDLVPAYDAQAGRLYFIDAQPGGNGISAWLYTALEDILPLAYDVALACRSDPLLEPMARNDMDWLLAFLGWSEHDTRAEPAQTRMSSHGKSSSRVRSFQQYDVEPEDTTPDMEYVKPPQPASPLPPTSPPRSSRPAVSVPRPPVTPPVQPEQKRDEPTPRPAAAVPRTPSMPPEQTDHKRDEPPSYRTSPRSSSSKPLVPDETPTPDTSSTPDVEATQTPPTRRKKQLPAYELYDADVEQVKPSSSDSQPAAPVSPNTTPASLQEPPSANAEAEKPQRAPARKRKRATKKEQAERTTSRAKTPKSPSASRSSSSGSDKASAPPKKRDLPESATIEEGGLSHNAAESKLGEPAHGSDQQAEQQLEIPPDADALLAKLQRLREKQAATARPKKSVESERRIREDEDE